jgi:hypothetical protein
VLLLAVLGTIQQQFNRDAEVLVPGVITFQYSDASIVIIATG